MKAFVWGLPIALALSVSLAHAEDLRFSISIKDHKFEPASLNVPAGKKFKLVVKNMDSSAEEFESDDLHREKIIGGGKEATINIGPLKAGTYKFFGEFNPKTAQGTLVAQ